MRNLQSLIISPDSSLRDAVAAINDGARQVALVVDEEQRLIALITDGNIRRGLLQGLDLDCPVSKVMNIEPIVCLVEDGLVATRRLMRRRQLHHVPIVDRDGRLIDLLWLDDVAEVKEQSTRVFLMVGGQGLRLRPLTESVPKPMLKVGGRPILEQIIESFADQGFLDFTLSINYLGEVIRQYFGDGHKMGVKIRYIEEADRLGTAGALSLLSAVPDQPVIVMNGDLLTSIRFEDVLQFHKDTGAIATMCARQFDMQVPFGVIETDGTRMMRIAEKPIHHHLVNAGVYVLSPEVFAGLEEGKALDMPDLLSSLSAQHHHVAVYSVDEYWRDIGRIEDLEQARSEFSGGD